MTICSSTLHRTHVRHIVRYFAWSDLSPFLKKMGDTGKLPETSISSLTGAPTVYSKISNSPFLSD